MAQGKGYQGLVHIPENPTQECLLFLRDKACLGIAYLTHPKEIERNFGLEVGEYVKMSGLNPRGVKVTDEYLGSVLDELRSSAGDIDAMLLGMYRKNWKRDHPHEPLPDHLDLRKKTCIGNRRGHSFSFS